MKSRLTILTGTAALGASLAVALLPVSAVAQTGLAPLPKHFPKPPHSSILKEHFKGKDHDYMLQVTSRKSALAFWQHKLPDRGWTFTKASHGGGLSIYHFKGHGYGGKKTEIYFRKAQPHRAVVLFHRTS